MKYRLICIAVVAATILSAALLTSAQSGLVVTRVHQHLEAQPKLESEKDSAEFSTHLPIICLEADETQLTFELGVYENGYEYLIKNTVNGSVRVMDSSLYNNHLSDEPAVSSAANIRLRGASSIYHDKHNFKLTFLREDGTENKDIGLMGMEPYDEWALHGPFLDRSQLRNYLCMNVSGQLLAGTPDVRFCELFLNGEYQGLYLATETVARSKGRVDIDSYEDGSAVSSYIIRQDRYFEGSTRLNVFGSYTYIINGITPMEVVYPGERLTEGIRAYIEKDFSAFEKALYSFDYDDPVLGYRHYIDVGSFIDYALVNEFFQNHDAGVLSTYFYKDTRGKIHAGPVWDFNNAADNYIPSAHDEQSFSVLLSPHYEQLMKDDYFVKRFIRRYRQLRETILSEERLLAYIDDSVAYLGDAVERNFEVWGETLDREALSRYIKLHPEYRNPESYEEAVADLKEYIVWRGAWLDEHIDTLLQYCHESAVKQYNP